MAAQVSRLQESTASLNIFSASINGHVADVNTWSASVKGHISDLNTYTSSLRAAITASGVNITVNGDTTIKGNLFVQGTQTVVDSTTVNIADNILVLNAAGTSDGGIQVRDASGGSTTSGSLLWDVTNDYWKAGKLGTESQILVAGGMGVVSGSSQIFIDSTNGYSTFSSSLATSISASNATITLVSQSLGGGTTGNRLSRIEESTASLNTFSASVNGHIADINTKTGSFEAKFTTLASVTSSALTRLSRIEESTASLNLYTSSQDTKNSTLSLYTASIDSKNTTLAGVTASFNTATASLNTFSASALTRFTRIEESTASLNLYTSSQDTKNSTLGLYTASLETKNSTLSLYTASLDTKNTTLAGVTASFNTATASLNTFSASTLTRLSRIEESTASLNIFSASVNGHIADINSKTGSYATINGNSFNGSQLITGSLSVSQNITGSASASFASLAVNTSTPSQKIHLKGAVGIENGTTGGATADQLVFGYNGSGLTQYVHKIQTGHDAQAGLNRMDFLIANSSNTTKTPLQLRHDRVIVSGSTYVSGDLIVTGSINGLINATNGVISGSSQVDITATTGYTSFSGSIATSISASVAGATWTNISGKPAGLVSGSSQIVLNDANKTGFDTTDVAEGTNLYHTTARVQAVVTDNYIQTTLTLIDGGTY